MKPLPVDAARLRREFPALDDGDVAAYETVTRRILGRAAPADRARVTREVLARGREAAGRAAKGDPLSEDDALALRYLRAVGKMQPGAERRRP